MMFMWVYMYLYVCIYMESWAHRYIEPSWRPFDPHMCGPVAPEFKNLYTSRAKLQVEILNVARYLLLDNGHMYLYNEPIRRLIYTYIV